MDAPYRPAEPAPAADQAAEPNLPKPGVLQPAALAPEQSGAYIGVSRQTIYRLIAAGQIRAFKIGRATRIPVSDLDALIGGGDPS